LRESRFAGIETLNALFRERWRRVDSRSRCIRNFHLGVVLAPVGLYGLISLPLIP